LLVSSRRPSSLERYAIGIKAKCLIHPLISSFREI
jgi:hypothetical protein